MAKCTVRMLRNPSVAFGCTLHEGETGELDQSLAEQLAQLNLAAIVSMPKSIKAVPDEPAIKAQEPDEPAETADDKVDRPKKPGK